MNLIRVGNSIINLDLVEQIDIEPAVVTITFVAPLAMTGTMLNRRAFRGGDAADLRRWLSDPGVVSDIRQNPKNEEGSRKRRTRTQD